MTKKAIEKKKYKIILSKDNGIIVLGETTSDDIEGLIYKGGYRDVIIVKYLIEYNLENVIPENGTFTFMQQGDYGIITPTPNEGYEVDKILGNMGISRMDIDTELTEGSKVKIVAGPFNGMFGTISMVDMDNQKLELNVDLFGQETSVEIEIAQIEIAENN